ncbi:MAG TPA: CatA-like O-acetyltransferase [Pyrinomonadaceae bacterium]|jgi:Chloramphenicol O-acetyltransferase
MAHFLELATWPRRQLYDFFIDYSQPYFNVCARLDVTKLLALVRQRKIKFSVAIHYFGLRIANEIEPFRYRLKDGGVFVYDVIDGGTTVLLPNDTFSYAYFGYHRDFQRFTDEMGEAVDQVRNGTGELKPTMRDDVIYHTTLPWISFTSFSHARTSGRGESIPRFVFGKFVEEQGRLMMPFSVEVHHALMDGIDVGRYLNNFEQALSDPEAFIKGN